ncbi:MAG: cytochrome P450 [Acidimicrobiia bacterium]|nr:cytochrome P450 [Acidimicrobiia bacterium]
MESIDDQLVSRQFMEDPYPVYRRLQEEAPVYWSDAWDCWLLTRFAHVDAVIRSPASYQNRVYATWMEKIPTEHRQELSSFVDYWTTSGFSQADPPEHTRIRRVVSKALPPDALAAIRRRVEALADSLLDEVTESGRTDLPPDFAVPLPAIAVSELVGLPAGERVQFREWTNQYLEFLGPGGLDVDVMRRSQAGLTSLRRWLMDLLEDRRANPTDDVLSSLVAADEAGDVMSTDELLSTCVDLVTGGDDTTTNMLGNGMMALLEHPDQLDLLREDPSLMKNAVEELVRYECPFQMVFRLTTTDVEIGGTVIPEGQVVRLILGAANRDPEQFENPDSIDIRRDHIRHLGFGFGMHYCVGQVLARSELQVSFERLIDRLPNVRLAGKPVRLPSVGPRGFTSLPLAFDPTPRLL